MLGMAAVVHECLWSFMVFTDLGQFCTNNVGLPEVGAQSTLPVVYVGHDKPPSETRSTNLAKTSFRVCLLVRSNSGWPRRTQENLVTFLKQEVKLANTFRTIAETTQDPTHHSKLLHDIQLAVNTIRRFHERIGDKSVRAELTREAGKLDEFLLNTD